MFARTYHYLQIFPVILLLFSTQSYQPLLSHGGLMIESTILAIIASLGLAIGLMKPSKRARTTLVFCSVAAVALLLNQLIYKPTLGVLSILFVGFAANRLIGNKHLKTKNIFVRKPQILSSFLGLAIPFLVIDPLQSDVPHLIYFSYLLAISSSFYLCFKSMNLKNVRWYSLALVCLALVLFSFRLLLVMQILAALLFIALGGLVAYLILNRETIRNFETKYGSLFTKPEVVTVIYFALLAFLGALVLKAPFSQSNPESTHSFLDSFFTSMSAVCVTGLAVFDTAKDFSFWGQASILFLIQLGGLGITSLSAWILLVLKDRRLNLDHEAAMQNMAGHLKNIDLKSFIRRIFYYFLGVELSGTLLLTPAFMSSGDSFVTALWRALFTSVSAFCNAGFALQSDSLVSYQNSPTILLVTSILIIAGGFAPLLVLEFPAKLKKMRFSLQDKIVATTTLGLLLSGFVFFLIVEWNFALSNLDILDKITNAWFQSVTTRTAGFNSVDLTAMRDLSQFAFLLFMFIGGNPGSTAGGVKTVTIGLIIIACVNAIKEGSEARAFGKKIPVQSVFRAMLIVALGLVLHFVFFFFLSVTQNIDSLSLLFETFSALGTVGLSTGATAQLDEIGKILIIFCMLAGRVGPLTFVLLLLKRTKKFSWKVPTEDVSIT